MTLIPDPRCTCGHRLSEHPERYGLTLCTGHVHAIDASVEDAGAGARLASCGCPGFLAASERLLHGWEAGRVPASATEAAGVALALLTRRGWTPQADEGST